MTKAQKNILSVIISNTMITKGKNRGAIKGVEPCGSFDLRSLNSLIDSGYVESCDGVLGNGLVGTLKGLNAVDKN